MKRYKLVHDPEYRSQMVVRPDGKFVMVTDHEAEIARMTAALAQSRADTQAALAGCVKVVPLVQVGPQIAGYTCAGCVYFHSEYWKEPDGEGGMDSGTSATCTHGEGRHISSYLGVKPCVPSWCPVPKDSAAIQPDTSKLALVREALQAGINLIRGEAVGADWKRGCNEFVKKARTALATIGEEPRHD